MKKTLALVLALVMVLSMAFAVWAEDAPAADEAPAYATELKAGVGYAFVVEQGNLNKTLYLNGSMKNTYYFGSTENIDEAIIIYVEEVDGGFHLYHEVDGAKKYISVVQSGSHTNAVYVDADPVVFTWNAELNTATANVGGTDFYIGTYNNFDTISPSKTSYAATSFVGQFLAVVTPEEPPVEEPPVDEPEVPAALNLYQGEPNKGGQYTNSINAANKFGQKFTVPEGKMLVGLDFVQMFTYGDGNVNKGALTIWAWDTDYATTTAAEALCVVDLVNVADNSPLSIAIDAENLTGELFYEISYLEGTKTYAPCTAGGNADGVVSYYNGKENAGNMWGGGTGIASTITVADIPVEPEYINLYQGEPNKGGQYTNSINAANTFGQKFTVPAGKILAALDFAFSFTYGDGNSNKLTISVWAWDTDYATTVAAEPLYVGEYVNANDNSPLNIAIDADNLTGDLFYQIAYEGAKTFAPCTAGGNAEGVVSYYNGKENAGNMWGGGTGIACAIGVLEDPNYVPETPHEHNFVDGKCECGEEDPNYVPPVVVEEEVIKLYNGDPVANMANKSWESKFGQIFTVPAGKEMTKITLGFQAVDDPDGNGKPDANAIIKIWAWDTDYATTVAAEPLVVIEQNVGSGDNEFVLETALTGTLFWEAHAEEGERLAASGAKQKADGVINVIDGVENAACTGWDGANTIRAAITVVVDPDYVPHEHNFVDGKCECGEEDPNYQPPTTETTEEPTTEVTTEETTEETTEVTTEVTTEETTEVTTEETTVADTTAADTTAADTTAAGTTAAGTTAATTEEAKGGCGSVVGSAIAVAVIAMAGAAAVVLKKRD